MENKNKTLADLNKKTWYRALKTFYIFTFVSSLLIWAFDAYNSWYDGTLWSLFFIIISAVILQRAFYYIVLGRIFPPK